ncbi:hypothetical protein CEDDRAFT_01246 [Frankia sp. CeD]|nr:hypothetical protein CEDDRAFT_01246 [Frankia sp. CeD]
MAMNTRKLTASMVTGIAANLRARKRTMPDQARLTVVRSRKADGWARSPLTRSDR